MQAAGFLSRLPAVQSMPLKSSRRSCSNHLCLLFGRWTCTGQDFNALARGDILHVAACAFTADEAGFLNQPRHLLQSTLLPKHLWERDLAVRPQHLLIAFSAHLLVRLRVDIRI